VGTGIHPVDPGGHDTNAPALDGKGPTMGFTIDTQRQTADNDPSVGRKFRSDGPGDSQAPGSGPARTNNGNGGFIQDNRVAYYMDFRGRIIDLAPKPGPVEVIRLEMVILRVWKGLAGSECAQLTIPAREDVQFVFNQDFPGN